MVSSVVTWFPRDLSEIEKFERSEMLLDRVARYCCKSMNLYKDRGDEKGYESAEKALIQTNRLVAETILQRARKRT